MISKSHAKDSQVRSVSFQAKSSREEFSPWQLALRDKAFRLMKGSSYELRIDLTEIQK